MRELDRITRIQQLIAEIWKRIPDYRYFQLVSLMEYKFAESLGLETSERPDLFYVEDDKFETFLLGFYDDL